MQRFFRSKTSFAHKIFKPIALFMFCALSIIFSILHPSIILFILMPLFIYGFFLTQQEFKTPSKFFLFVLALYVVASFVFNIVFLFFDDS